MYEAVLFDLFDTVLDFHRDRMPLVSVNGESVRSSSGVVYEVLRPHLPEESYPDFHRAFVESYRDVERMRGADGREIRVEDRFRLLFLRLRIPFTPETERLLAAGVETHMRTLAEAMVPPEDARELLAWARPRYRLAIVSNFDHAPTAIRALERHGLAGFFEAVIVSSEVGWRKPRREIFEVAFKRLSVGPERSLFVGDSPAVDVLGAKGVGMDVAWLRHGGKTLPEGVPEPDYTISRLGEVATLLQDLCPLSASSPPEGERSR